MYLVFAAMVAVVAALLLTPGPRDACSGRRITRLEKLRRWFASGLMDRDEYRRRKKALQDEGTSDELVTREEWEEGGGCRARQEKRPAPKTGSRPSPSHPESEDNPDDDKAD